MWNKLCLGEANSKCYSNIPRNNKNQEDVRPSIILRSCAQQRFSFAPCHRVRVPGGQSYVRDSRLFSPSRRWNIPPSLVPSRVLVESWQVRDGFGRTTVITPAVGRVRWTEFFSSLMALE